MKKKFNPRKLAAKRWAGHKKTQTQPRRLRLTTIARIKARADKHGVTFDQAVCGLLEDAE